MRLDTVIADTSSKFGSLVSGAALTMLRLLLYLFVCSALHVHSGQKCFLFTLSYGLHLAQRNEALPVLFVATSEPRRI